jgi:transposase-like protein
MICPHCQQETGIGTAALFDHVFMSRTKCERCGKEFLIVNGVPMTREQYARRSKDSTG